jgi:hypothetical protein
VSSGADVESVNPYSCLEHEFMQAEARGKSIIVVYSALNRRSDWLPSYMKDYRDVAQPFWVRGARGELRGNYDYVKRALWREWAEVRPADSVWMRTILGSNILGLDRDLTQQELLYIMISSYVLSPKRLKNPYKLRIVCRGREGF